MKLLFQCEKKKNPDLCQISIQLARETWAITFHVMLTRGIFRLWTP